MFKRKRYEPETIDDSPALQEAAILPTLIESSASSHGDPIVISPEDASNPRVIDMHISPPNLYTPNLLGLTSRPVTRSRRKPVNPLPMLPPPPRRNPNITETMGGIPGGVRRLPPLQPAIFDDSPELPPERVLYGCQVRPNRNRRPTQTNEEFQRDLEQFIIDLQNC